MRHWRKIRGKAENPHGETTGFHLYIPEDADRDFWLQVAETYIRDQMPGLKPVPSSGTADVRTGPISGSPNRHFFKNFLPRNRFEHLKQVFRKSRAYRDLKGSAIAKSHGLLVPEINCVIEQRKWGITIGSTIITREVEGAIQLRKQLEALQRIGDTPARRQLLRQLGSEMARWHRARLRHGDARDSNILCRIPGNSEDTVISGQSIEFVWLDNERSRPVFRKRDLIRNLVQLNMTRSGVTKTDRMRFWTTYWENAAPVYRLRTRESVLRQVIAKSTKRWKERGWV